MMTMEVKAHMDPYFSLISGCIMNATRLRDYQHSGNFIKAATLKTTPVFIFNTKEKAG
jgi:hypothetical protein